MIGCGNPTEPTELKVDRDIPPSEDFDASYGFWGPDGETIYFKHSEELGSDPNPGKLDQLWKLDLETGRRQMIHPGRILNADISQDGEWFVFQSFFPPQYLYKMRSDGTELQRLTGPDSPNPEWEYTIKGRWSRGGNRILFSLSAGVSRGVSLMNSDGTNAEVIVPYGVHPNWSSDANKIVYINWDTTKVQQNQQQIYIANIDGSSPHQITNLKNTEFNIHDPNISPSGQKIAFTYNNEAYIMMVDSSNSIQQITSGPGYVRRPEWSPDGQTILFSRIILNGPERLYFLDVPTREITPVFPKETQ